LSKVFQKNWKEETFVSFISFTLVYKTPTPSNYKEMKNLSTTSKPSKEEQRVALQSYALLAEALEQVHDPNPEIEIEETKDKIKIPLRALKLLAQILKTTSEGKPISIVPIATEMTTQAAADLLGCSRPHLVKLLEGGVMPYTKVGRHRRVLFEDVMNYKKQQKEQQRQLLRAMMQDDEETGLYDT
jgi:excisionase family DNA binding protein